MRRIKISLSLKIIICTMLLFFLSIASLLNYQHFKNSRDGNIRRDAVAADLISDIITEHEKTSLIILNSYATRPLFIEAVRNRDLSSALRHLQDLNLNNSEMDLCFITDRAGKLWANYPAFPAAYGTDLSDRDWYRGTSRDWTPYVSSVFQLIVSDKPLAVALAVPVFDSSKNVIGILANSQRLSFIEALFPQVTSDSKTAVTVTDRDGHILYSSRYSYKKAVTKYQNLNVIHAQTAKNDRRSVHPDPSKLIDGQYFTVRRISSLEWTVILERRLADSLLAESGSYIQISCIILLVFICTALLLVYQQYLNRNEQIIRRTETTLKEVHHRIKNNMNTLTSLLRIQMETHDNADSKIILQDAISRITSMMVLYDKLYRYEDCSRIDIKEYLPALISEIISIFQRGDRIRVVTRIDSIMLNEKIISPIGIIINELITNSIKYAFLGREYGSLTVTATKSGNTLTLIFEDDGNGFPGAFNSDAADGFGMQLVNLLTAQLHGSLSIHKKNPTRFVFTFEI